MPGRDEVQAAYFALLRAREEVQALRRYDEYLHDERRRITRFLAEGDALEAPVDRRLRRALSHTDEAVGRALERRLGAIDDELAHLPDRLEAALAYVSEAEQEHDQLRHSA